MTYNVHVAEYKRYPVKEKLEVKTMAENRKIISPKGNVQTKGIETTNGARIFGIVCAVSSVIGMFLMGLGFGAIWFVSSILLVIVCIIMDTFIKRLNAIISLLKDSEYIIRNVAEVVVTPVSDTYKSQPSLISRLNGEADTSSSNEPWSCRQCGYVNLAASRECSSCGRPR